MKITVLCENTTSDPALTAEHGLSIFIESENRKILFDMGQTDAFAENAGKLGIDLASADTAILSHGHYDHGGGLHCFLEINQSAPVYVSEHAFGDHFNGSGKYIGLDKSLMSKKRLVPVCGSLKIDDHTEILTADHNSLAYPIQPCGLGVMREGHIINEDFRHEQFLLIRENGRNYLFSGCAHTGVLNLISLFSPDVFIGGFHYSKLDTSSDRTELEKAAHIMKNSGISFYTGHCTGRGQFDVLKETVKDRLIYADVGFSAEI